MDKRRFGMILLVVAGALALMAWQQSKNQDTPSDTPPDEPTVAPREPALPQAPQTQPAETSVDAETPAEATSTDEPAAAPPAETPTLGAAPHVRWLADRFPARQPVLGSLTPEEGYRFQVTFDNAKAGLQEVQLVDYFETVHDKQLWDEVKQDQAAYAARVAENPELYKGHYRVIKPVAFGGNRQLAMETQNITFAIGENTAPVSLQQAFPLATWRYSDRSEDENSQSITFAFTVKENLSVDQAQQPESLRDVFTLYKTYTIIKGSYSIDVSMRMVNHTEETIHLTIDQTGPTGVPQAGYRNDERQVVVAKLDDGAIIPNKDADVGKLIAAPFAKRETVGSSTAETEPVVWIGLVNKYFGAVLYPMPKMETQLNAVSYTVNYYTVAVQASAPAHDAPANGTGRMWLTGTELTDIVLKPASEDPATEIELDVFVGPKKRDLFRETPLYAKLKYSETITARSCVCPESLIAYLRRGLLWLLGVFSSFLFGNYGLAIMLLVAVVRLVLHPLTKKGQVMMSKTQKKMATLKPQIDRIREKYANDKAAQQRETMKLYKEHGTGMGGMLGCLPMMLQMPIWIALFSGLNTSVELRHAAFLPVWITDLSVPDALYTFNEPLNLGLFTLASLNLLPLLLGVSMYFQSKLNPSMSGSASTMSPEQEQQQKMMRFMMPVMMLFFFYNMPSGLNLYIMASTTVGVAEQYFIRKHIREQDELVAATETTVKAPGKGARDSRTKKPKGPFWTKRS